MNKKNLRNLTILIIATLFVITACHKKPNGGDWEYKIGHFSDKPINLGFLNSNFDDYNSALNQSGETFPLCFSSNRNSSGAHFDIVYKFMTILYDWESRDLYVGELIYSSMNTEIQSNSIHNAVGKMNTQSDEFGPFLLPLGTKPDPSNQLWGEYYANVFLFSNDENGNQDIRFIENQNQKSYNDSKHIKFLNTPFDDAYPSFNQEDSGLYFCSNRQGEFDIFFAKVDFSSKDWPIIFSDTTSKPIQKIMALSSDSADKCPFIIGNTMVFASNRPGGYGGYDLYYSKLEKGSWSSPQNFGNRVNTPSDEYRPIIRREEGFDNDFMIFSSNRSGGKGGFDLYYVGVQKVPW